MLKLWTHALFYNKYTIFHHIQRLALYNAVVTVILYLTMTPPSTKHSREMIYFH